MKFQRDFIHEIYDNPVGTKRAYLSIARKNGKSALIAAIALAHIVGPEAKQNRVEMVEAEARSLMDGNRVNGCMLEVRAFDSLLVDFAQSVGALVIIRGLRAISDFEYEFQMAATNARLCPKIETVFLPASETNQFISSRFVKQIARLGGDVSSFVSEEVRAKLEALRRG